MGVARGCAAEAAARHLPVNGRCRFSGRAEPSSKDSLRSRVHSRTLSRTLALLAFLSVSPTVRLSGAQCPDGAPPPCARPKPTSSHAAPAERTPSLTVLYLVTGPGDTAAVALAEGITEELITRPSVVTGLRITSRSVALRFRARVPADPQR